jgi:SAM-dependent methyltransferase
MQLPKKIEGFNCYAPDLAVSNSDFDPESFEFLYQYEETNFWFRSRNQVIQILFRNFRKKDVPDVFLEIGCGTGYVLKGLAKFDRLTLNGSEIYLEGLKYAKRRLPYVEFFQMDATNIPFRNLYDYVGAFDVLEHIDDDLSVMSNVHKALKSNGLFFISVPQYPFMWSHLDDIACHKRRYTKHEMFNKLKLSGFEVLYSTSFVFSLFPLMIISRILKRNKENHNVARIKIQEYELNLPRPINALFEWILKIDELCIKNKFTLPFGGGLIVVASKK